MAPPTSTVDLGQLYAHAQKVVQIQHPLDRVVGAVKDVTPMGFDIAYGTACQFFAMMIMPVRENAEDAVVKVSRSLEITSDKLIKAVDYYDKNEQSHAHTLRKLTEDISVKDNWLVEKGANFSWKDYDVTDGGPFHAGQGGNWLNGLGLFDNGKQLYDEITDSSKQNYGAMVGLAASFGFDGISLANDPIGTLSAWGVSWLIEHVKPLTLILNSLAGNPDMIKAAAKTWQNVGSELDRLGKHYADAVTAGTGNWQGGAGDNYRDRTAKTTVDSLFATSQLANAMSVVVATTGELVNLARTLVRDIIADLVAQVVKAGLKRLGLVLPNDMLGEIAKKVKWGKQVFEFMLTLVKALGGHIPKLIECYKSVAATVPHLNGI
jgi:hypothetical protein